MIKPKQQQIPPQSNQAGFTIIESLLAILVVTILMVGVAPVIVLSVATRVQAKRVEQGADAARAYIDGVRSGAVGAPNPPIATTAFSGNAAPSSALPSCPTSNSYCSGSQSLYCVNLDENNGCTSNSNKDLIIQAFRNGVPARPQNGYKLGIRVYRADAFSTPGPLKTMGVDKAKAQTFSAGALDRKSPQFETTTEIAGNNTSLRNLCARLRNPGNIANSCQ
ncbi:MULTISPECIES: hormogonium polysaccharide secretion pseudopilin HpsB [Cyanophyceae]|uniref:hormogonium polysaccharide secretion pseudopilin HpsB n=1 Tax=Cyanophyceae TaxID=3028117 RepID=UPI001689D70E|nr:hormogonium polysaccharide secretion pseudopilin HpsB [Trichocoleus sp. FACHB-832]MBD1908848.1 type II secretion system protein [Trichocoleus sp. FACHB-832]